MWVVAMVCLGLGAVVLCVCCCRLLGVECGRSGSQSGGVLWTLASILATDIELLFLRVDNASIKPAPVESVCVTVVSAFLARLVLGGIGGVVQGVVVEDVEVVEDGLWYGVEDVGFWVRWVSVRS